jgi:AcrR family transcriptional regulator
MAASAAGDVGERAAEDLTARARIRDAALRLFAERGMDGATIRDIARAAGVSGGLVRHHFGSKDGLREACDAYALDQIMRIKEQALLEGQLGNMGFMSAAHPTILLTYRYFARSLVDGTPAAAAMFDTMVDLAEAWLAQHHPGEIADRRGFAAVLIAMETGAMAMHRELSRSLGADVFTPAGNLLLARARIDFYSQPLLSPDVAAQARAAIEYLQARQPATPEPRPGAEPHSER